MSADAAAATQRQFEEEEQAYWRLRETLRRTHPGKWVAVVNASVVAVGEQMGEVISEALGQTGSSVMYVTQVGDENPEYRIRQTSTGRFSTAHRRPMPMIT